MFQRGSLGHVIHSSFALSPCKVVLCALVCTAHESPILSKHKQSLVYNYVLS